MAKNNKDVSILFWMFAIFIMALPCVGMIMVIIWAFWGGNESRKNYFRAILIWFVLFALVWSGLLVLGVWPAVWVHLQQVIKEFQHSKH